MVSWASPLTVAVMPAVTTSPGSTLRVITTPSMGAVIWQ